MVLEAVWERGQAPQAVLRSRAAKQKLVQLRGAVEVRLVACPHDLRSGLFARKMGLQRAIPNTSQIGQASREAL